MTESVIMRQFGRAAVPGPDIGTARTEGTVIGASIPRGLGADWLGSPPAALRMVQQAAVTLSVGSC